MALDNSCLRRSPDFRLKRTEASGEGWKLHVKWKTWARECCQNFFYGKLLRSGRGVTPNPLTFLEVKLIPQGGGGTLQFRKLQIDPRTVFFWWKKTLFKVKFVWILSCEEGQGVPIFNSFKFGAIGIRGLVKKRHFLGIFPKWPEPPPPYPPFGNFHLRFPIFFGQVEQF